MHAVSADSTSNSDITPRIPPKEAIENYKENSEFNYERVYHQDKSWWDDVKQWIKDFFSDLFDLPEVKGFDYWEAVMWILMALTLGAIIYFVFKNEIATFWGKRNSRNSKTLKTEFVDLTEDTVTLETKLQNAIAQKNYAEAVRLYYTLALKNLVDTGHIEFRIDKTNSEYLYELPQEGLKQPFKKLTFYFDYIFYGEFEATENIFVKTQEQYNLLLNKLKAVPAK
jgi:hypothetical protein